MTATRQHLSRIANHLASLPFVDKVDFERPAPQADGDSPWRIKLTTPRREYRLAAAIKRTALSYAVVDRALATMRSGRRGDALGILVAPYVSPEMGRYLAERGGNYVDEVGNCRLVLDERYVALVEGRRPPRRPVSLAGIRAPGYQVLFALLAESELLRSTVRGIAAAAGVSKTTAATILHRLREEQLVVPGRQGHRILRPSELLDRWLNAYRDAVRPHLFVGTYRTPDADPETLVNRLEEILERENLPGVWGGGAALHRINGRYRGPSTVLHLPEPPADLGSTLRALPAKDGPLTILRLPGPVGASGLAHRTAHPLLVYTELMVAGDERAREMAEEFRAEYLADLD